MSPATAYARRRRVRRGWMPFFSLLVLAVVVALVLGARASARLHDVRYGVLVGTVPQGEWAALDEARYGYRLRLDAVDRISEGGLPGLQVLAVRMTVLPTQTPTGQEALGCDITLRTASGERILQSGPVVAPEAATDCYGSAESFTGFTARAGEPYETVAVFQVRPRDVEGVTVEVSPSDLHSVAATLWENWHFVPAR
ncbi:hypothetical protein AADG42_15715 [Ammonicoccus fulvus]|uniref:DUF4352 domain-containing protein n=1 Tax=Ammonicoccus fulvus TaxID=3138240 RepID=A0ABZ3FVU0_9ACTN